MKCLCIGDLGDGKVYAVYLPFSANVGIVRVKRKRDSNIFVESITLDKPIGLLAPFRYSKPDQGNVRSNYNLRALLIANIALTFDGLPLRVTSVSGYCSEFSEAMRRVITGIETSRLGKEDSEVKSDIRVRSTEKHAGKNSASLVSHTEEPAEELHSRTVHDERVKT